MRRRPRKGRVYDLSGTQLPADKVLVLRKRRFVDENFSNLNLEHFDAERCHFIRCKFEKVRFSSAAFASGRSQSTYVDCSFDGARIRSGPIGPARFEHCSFLDVVLSDWFCMEAEFVDCIFTGEIRGGWFNGTVLNEEMQKALGRNRNEISGNDFAGVKLIDVAFRTGVDLTRQRLPSSPEYVFLPDARDALNRATTRVRQWPDGEERVGAVSMLKTLSSELEHGQRQLLLREGDVFPKDRSIWDALVRVLRDVA
jgi:uncharacterized protein YjbI with pentapeptide repeats